MKALAIGKDIFKQGMKYWDSLMQHGAIFPAITPPFPR
jgi:hypothetical protein